MIGKLDSSEEQVLLDFKKKLLQKFPDKFVSLMVYGSKARGDFHSESDIDVLVIFKDVNWRITDMVREIGYALDDIIDYRLSIQVMSEKKIEYLKQNNYQFLQNVLHDAVVA